MDNRERKRTVTAVIPTFNRADLLAQSLDSVLGQTCPPDEIIVVDDGSTDATPERLSRYGERIRCLHQANRGKAAALNYALGAANGDAIWIMDDDDLALPDALQRHLALLDGDHQADFTYSGVWCFEGESPPPPLEDCLLWQRPDIPRAEFFIRAMELFPANHQTMLVPKACYDAIGGLDESMIYGEDYDVILRLARRFRAGRVAEPTVLLREHHGARGPAAERAHAVERRAKWQLYDKKIFRKLRNALTLDEYLPLGTAEMPLTDAGTRRALLQRGCIMARHGLFDESLKDIFDATTAPRMQARMTSAERGIVGRMMDFDDAVLRPQEAFVPAAARLFRRRAPGLLKPAMAGVSWSLRRQAAARDLAGAAVSVSLLTRLAASAIPALVGVRAAHARSNGADAA